MQIGGRVRAVIDFTYDTGETIQAGTVGYVQQIVAKKGEQSKVSVAWDGRGGPNEPANVVELTSCGNVEAV